STDARERLSTRRHLRDVRRLVVERLNLSLGGRTEMTSMKRMIFGIAAFALLASHAWAADEMTDVKKALATQHAQNIKRLQDWIALPSIAAENRNTKEGAE